MCECASVCVRACVRVCVCVEGGGKVLRESKFNMYKGTCAGGLQGSRVGVCVHGYFMSLTGRVVSQWGSCSLSL